MTRFVEQEEKSLRERNEKNGENDTLLFKGKSRNYFYYFLQRKDSTRLSMRKFSCIDLYDILINVCSELLNSFEAQLSADQIKSIYNKKISIIHLLFKNRYNPKLSVEYRTFNEFIEDLREDRLDLEDKTVDQ